MSSLSCTSISRASRTLARGWGEETMDRQATAYDTTAASRGVACPWRALTPKGIHMAEDVLAPVSDQIIWSFPVQLQPGYSQAPSPAVVLWEMGGREWGVGASGGPQLRVVRVRNNRWTGLMPAVRYRTCRGPASPAQRPGGPHTSYCSGQLGSSSSSSSS